VDSYAANTPDRQVIHRAFLIAAEHGELCRPIHILAALAETHGPISDALNMNGDTSLLPKLADPPTVHGGGASYLAMQTQQAASQLASGRDETVGAEHLLVAVIDQREPEAMAALSQGGLDSGALRHVAVTILGAADLPVIVMPPLTPAGTVDRPPLPVDQLDPRAWSVLRWRQEHLPLRHVRGPNDWGALSHLEHQAAWRIADRLGVDDDQRYSLSAQHYREVDRRAHEAKPAVFETIEQAAERNHGQEIQRLRRSRPKILPNFMVGWPTWFANRRAGLRDKRFWLLTRSAYRGQPALSH
jgi:Clp amino terminal domain, pathogenicity island component